MRFALGMVAGAALVVVGLIVAACLAMRGPVEFL